ncbi:ABC-2 type transporter [Lachnospiraceae bacterium NE2001]|nr:ABC-2 type transporter [Lachnospiraceae bacterium NE2001]
MNGRTLFFSRFKALISDFWSLSILIMIVIISVMAAWISKNSEKAPMTVAIVNHDTGECGKKLENILSLDDTYRFCFVSKKEALRMTAVSEAHSMFEISEDFTEKIKNRRFDDLISEMVMKDTVELDSVREIIINSVIKVWIEELASDDLKNVADYTEAEMESFYVEAEEIWKGDIILDVVDHPYSDGKEKIEIRHDNPGLRWYAALVFLYLLLSGTWMMEYGRKGLVERIKQNGYPVWLVFLWQSLPGLIISVIGFIFTALYSGGSEGMKLIPAFVIYLIGITGMAYVVCVICRRFSTLLMVAPVMGLVVSTVSGLFAGVPDWADLWNRVSVIFPGHWFNEAVTFKSHMLIGIIVSLAWVLISVCIQNIVFRYRRKSAF